MQIYRCIHDDPEKRACIQTISPSFGPHTSQVDQIATKLARFFKRKTIIIMNVTKHVDDNMTH